jgi:hypothetical protein
MLDAKIASAQKSIFRDVAERWAPAIAIGAGLTGVAAGEPGTGIGVGGLLLAAGGRFMPGGATTAIRAAFSDKIAAATLKATRAVGPTLGRVTQVSTIDHLTTERLASLRSTLDMFRGADVAKVAYDGYVDGGMDRRVAQELAVYQAERIKLLQWAANSADRMTASKIVNAVDNPRRIHERLKRKELTQEDVVVLRNLFPDVYASWSGWAAKHLEENKTLSARDRKQLMMLANGPGYARMRSRILLAGAGERERKKPRQIGSQSIGMLQTESQRIQREAQK